MKALYITNDRAMKLASGETDFIPWAWDCNYRGDVLIVHGNQHEAQGHVVCVASLAETRPITESEARECGRSGFAGFVFRFEDIHRVEPGRTVPAGTGLYEVSESSESATAAPATMGGLFE